MVLMMDLLKKKKKMSHPSPSVTPLLLLFRFHSSSLCSIFYSSTRVTTHSFYPFPLTCLPSPSSSLVAVNDIDRGWSAFSSFSYYLSFFLDMNHASSYVSEGLKKCEDSRTKSVIANSYDKRRKWKGIELKEASFIWLYIWLWHVLFYSERKRRWHARNYSNNQVNLVYTTLSHFLTPISINTISDGNYFLILLFSSSTLSLLKDESSA